MSAFPDIRGFVAEHGGAGTAVVEHIGRVGVRLVVVAADGRFVDAVFAEREAAETAAAAAGVPLGEWDRDLCARVTVSPAERRRIAGTGR